VDLHPPRRAALPRAELRERHGANTVKELIEAAKKRPGEIPYSSSGPGGAPHLAMELFKRQAGVDLTHVPYKGSAPGMNDLLGGRVMVTMDSLLQSLPQIKAGRLKALAVLGPKRSALLPEVPTVAEAGVPGYALTNWFGLLAPAGTPKEVLLKLNADVLRVLKDEEIRKRISEMGADVVGNSAQAFGAAMRAESAQWAEVIKAADIKAE
jgi:tripartite-type tricarboxylate transporter receptor subunit TctC